MSSLWWPLLRQGPEYSGAAWPSLAPGPTSHSRHPQQPMSLPYLGRSVSTPNAKAEHHFHVPPAPSLHPGRRSPWHDGVQTTTPAAGAAKAAGARPKVGMMTWLSCQARREAQMCFPCIYPCILDRGHLKRAPSALASLTTDMPALSCQLHHGFKPLPQVGRPRKYDLLADAGSSGGEGSGTGDRSSSGASKQEALARRYGIADCSRYHGCCMSGVAWLLRTSLCKACMSHLCCKLSWSPTVRLIVSDDSFGVTSYRRERNRASALEAYYRGKARRTELESQLLELKEEDAALRALAAMIELDSGAAGDSTI